MERIDRHSFAIALCLECGWRDEGEEQRVAQHVFKHVERERHVVEVVRTEVRLHAPRAREP